MIKVIACAIYQPYIEHLALEQSLDITYLEIQQHNYPKTLSKNIQKEIDRTKNATKIIILYGLCGNALLEIKARDIPLVLVRVHDCLSVLLGSKKRYHTLFNHRLSSAWSCYSLQQKGVQWVDEKTYQTWNNVYDEETIQYLQSCLCKKCDIYIYLHLPKEQIEESIKEVIVGDLQFLKDILTLQSKELVELKKGQYLTNSLDLEEVFTIKEEIEWKS